MPRRVCAAHQLNRAVQLCFGEKDGAIAELLSNCRRIVSHVKKSVKAVDELRLAQLAD